MEATKVTDRTGCKRRAPIEESIEWYGPGQTKVFEIGGVHLAVRLVDRKGRRARIALKGVGQVPQSGASVRIT